MKILRHVGTRSLIAMNVANLIVYVFRRRPENITKTGDVIKNIFINVALSLSLACTHGNTKPLRASSQTAFYIRS